MRHRITTIVLMPLFLGHTTALHVLRMREAESFAPAGNQDLCHCFASKKALSRLDLSLLEGFSALDVLVSSYGEIRAWSGIRCHLCKAHLPFGSFIEISDDVFVASPALCYIQQAAQLTLAQAIALGAELCGTFVLDKRLPMGIRSRRPLIQLDDLVSYVNRCSNIDGIKKAKRALDYILPRSASPMETITELVFCLPPRLGGFGLPMPEMNYEILMRGAALPIATTETIRADVYWKDHRFGLEYQGRLSHASLTKISADIQRQLAAEQINIELQFLTVEQIRHEAQRVAIAKKIARKLGVEISLDRTFLIRNQRLVDELLAASNQ